MVLSSPKLDNGMAKIQQHHEKNEKKLQDENTSPSSKKTAWTNTYKPPTSGQAVFSRKRPDKCPRFFFGCKTGFFSLKNPENSGKKIRLHHLHSELAIPGVRRFSQFYRVVLLKAPQNSKSYAAIFGPLK